MYLFILPSLVAILLVSLLASLSARFLDRLLANCYVSLSRGGNWRLEAWSLGTLETGWLGGLDDVSELTKSVKQVK